MELSVESINAIMLNVGLEKTDGRWNWKRINSPFTRIYCVTEGTARLHLPDKVQTLRPGHLYIIPAYTTHSYECHGVFTHYYLHFCEGFKKGTDIFDIYQLPYEVEATANDQLIFSTMCNLFPDAKLTATDPGKYDNSAKFATFVERYNNLPLQQKMWLRGCILILLSKFVEKAVMRNWTSDPRIARITAYINKHINEDIDIDDLADIACVTKAYLIRLFKSKTGLSPLHYINRKKIEKAELLLVTDNISIKEVAYNAGFTDHSYFIRLFKKITGKTPLEYRKTMR